MNILHLNSLELQYLMLVGWLKNDKMKRLLLALIGSWSISITIGQIKTNYQFQSNDWIVEAQNKDSTFVKYDSSNLVMDSKAGVTIWWRYLLTGHYIIEYDRSFLFDKVYFSRLSDLNQFWMTRTIKGVPPFGRDGRLEAYNDLLLLYMGYGGNSNSTTRFRLYDGKERILLREYLHPSFLLQKTVTYHVKTEVYKNVSSVWINGLLIFQYKDQKPLPAGYFGFRQTWSAQKISNFSITTFNNNE